MPNTTDDVVHHMARKHLKLVWYHAAGSGKRHRDHLELQTIKQSALNMTSLGFKGPMAVPRELLNELLQLKLVEKIAAPSDASHSVYHLTEAGRAHAQQS